MLCLVQAKSIAPWDVSPACVGGTAQRTFLWVLAVMGICPTEINHRAPGALFGAGDVTDFHSAMSLAYLETTAQSALD